MSGAVQFEVNGRAVRLAIDQETPLLAALRNHLGLVGTRFGCGLEQCGACLVLIDGRAEKSCARPIGTLAGRKVTTIEGLGTPQRAHPLQEAFLDEQAGQCGYCLSGILIAAKDLLDRNPAPSRADIQTALDGNICRCGSHNRIIRAVARAAAAISRASAG